MRKKITFLFFTTLFFACKKTGVNQSASDLTFIESARKYFLNSNITSGSVNVNNPMAQIQRSADWANAYMTDLSIGKAVFVPIKYAKEFFIKTNFGGRNNFKLSDLTKLLIYKDLSGAYHSEVITSLPDSDYLKSDFTHFSGITLIEDWQGNTLHTYKFDQNGKISKPSGSIDYSAKEPTELSRTSVNTFHVIATCYTIEGYNYAGDDVGDGYAWSEPAGCDFTYVDGGGSGGSLGGGPSAPDYGKAGGGPTNTNTSPSTSLLPSAQHIISNVPDYLKCFNNVSGQGNIYTVTVCIDQPVPGSRTSWGFTLLGADGSSGGNNPVNPGHTFLIFTQTFGSTIITRNVGFYPNGAVLPSRWTRTQPGVLNDDDDHSYDISGTMALDNAQFFNMLNFVQNSATPGYMYDLSSNNCTTWAINAFGAAGINLPSTIGTWPNGGAGNDPGDLGEDLRNHPPAGMTISTSLSPHFNGGTCQ